MKRRRKEAKKERGNKGGLEKGEKMGEGESGRGPPQ